MYWLELQDIHVPVCKINLIMITLKFLTLFNHAPQTLDLLLTPAHLNFYQLCSQTMELAAGASNRSFAIITINQAQSETSPI